MLGGVGGVFGKHGFLNGEVEYVNYAGNRFLFDGFAADEALLNDEVDANLGGAVKIRAGGELVVGDLRFRAGGGLEQSPIEGDDNLYSSLSAGFGIRKKSVFFDIGYRRSGLNTAYIPYQTSEAPAQLVDNDLLREHFIATLGFRF